MAVKVASIYAGLAKTGYVITSKFDLRWLVNINHCEGFHFDSCPFNCRSRRAGCNRSPGCRVLHKYGFAIDLTSSVYNQDVSRDLGSGVVFLVYVLEQDNNNIMGLHQMFNDTNFCFGETFDIHIQQ